MKKMLHDRCGGVVSRRTRICRRCGKIPPGGRVTLVKTTNHQKGVSGKEQHIQNFFTRVFK